MNKKIKRFILNMLLFCGLITIDRITKIWAESSLQHRDAIPVIKDVLELYYLPNGNTGAAFGILSGHRVFFLIIAITVVTVIMYMVYNMPEGKKYRPVMILLVFIAAGGAGNMVDRFLHGSVTDFIYISCINFPVFNVADMYVSICTVILALVVLFALSEADYNSLEDAFMAPFKKKKQEK